MILPFAVRAFRGYTDIVSLPGLSGTLIEPDSVEPLSVFADFARSRGWVSGYLQLSYANSGLAVSSLPTVQAHNHLFVFDLDTWSADVSLGHNMRKTLRRCDRDGAILTTDQDRLSRAFPDLYAESMRRFGKAVDFGPDVLRRWFADPCVTLFGGERNGRLEIVALCRRLGHRAEGHLVGSTDQSRDLHAWLFWKTAEAFGQHGVTEYNIGGYGTLGDGLDQLKTRLGARRVPMGAVRQIYDVTAFGRLCAEMAADPNSRYFPPYRTPGA